MGEIAATIAEIRPEKAAPAAADDIEILSGKMVFTSEHRACLNGLASVTGT
jgi:hypothetical protein